MVARQQGDTPAPGAKVAVDLIDADDGHLVGQQNGVVDADGMVRFEFPPPPAGAYKVVGRATTKDDKPLGESSDAVAVRAVGPELADARVNTDLLKEIAKATGGAFFDSTSF